MSLAWIIYFIDVLCDNKGLGFIGFLGCVMWFCGFIVSMSSGMCREGERGYDDSQQFLLIYKKLLPVKVLVATLLLYNIFIPSKDTAYKMLAAYGVESIVTNDKVQELGGKSLDVLNKAMDDYLKESEPDSKDSK